MKRDYRGLCLCLMLVLAAPAADAADKFHDLSVKGAAESEIGKSKLLDVPFYMSGQKHAGVAKDLGVFTSNKRTNAFGKSDEAACQIAFLSAVISLQSRSNKLGGNAIIDIKSVSKKGELVSATKFRCAAGFAVANVVLKGRVVKLNK